MSKPTAPQEPEDWSDSDRRVLAHLLYAIEYGRWHLDNKKRKEFWPRVGRFFESGAVVALISVLIGGIFSQWVASEYQERLKTREFDLVAHKEFLDRRRDLIKQIPLLVNTSIIAADGAVESTSGRLPQIDAAALRVAFNDSLDKWGAGREEVNFWIDYYYADNPDVLRAWHLVRDGTTGYQTSAQEIDDCFSKGEACGGELEERRARHAALKQDLRGAMKNLFDAFFASEKRKPSAE